MRCTAIGLIGIFVFGPLTGLLPAEAQEPGEVYHIGYLTNGATPNVRFQDALRELGYVEGKNVNIEWRFAKGKLDRQLEFARELVALKVDLLVTAGVAPTRAAKEATQTIPIVMWNASDDPVRQGLVASLARPGGNITGYIDASEELGGKRLQLLKETVPEMSRAAILWQRDSPAGIAHFNKAEVAARMLGLELQSLGIRRPDDLEKAFRTAITGRAEGLYIAAFGGVVRSHRARILELEATTPLPAVYTNSNYVRAGGLMSYAHDRLEQSRRVAHLVDRIFKGADPGDLPVERPTKFELTVNLKTARKNGITIPSSILYRANAVIR